MEKNKLKQLIVEHKERFLKPAQLVRRGIQKHIESYVKQREIVIISGVRRSGKSSLMKLISDDFQQIYHVSQDNILFLNFEDERFIEFTHRDFEPLYETFIEIYQPRGKKYFFLDEIQNIKGWERWVNRMYEFEDVKIFVTGSNATLLSPEIASALTGRNRQVHTYPFSFNELLKLRNCSFDEKDLYIREGKVKIKNLFREYRELGGFPEVLKNRDVTLLEQYFKDILYRDIVARYRIRNVREIRELALFLASNTGTIQSYKNLKEMIQVKSLNTVKNYLEILEDVYIFFRLTLFDYSIKRQIYNPSKVYSIDPALSRSVAFKFSQDLGRLYGNMVFVELMRRGNQIFYWKSRKGQEVDFLIKRGLKIEKAIQVCTSLSDKRTKQREIEGLLAAHEELKAKNLTILTEDDEGEEMFDKNKIYIIPLWKWLLTDK